MFPVDDSTMPPCGPVYGNNMNQVHAVQGTKIDR